MPRFVVLTHDHPFLHWDLMLETGSTLRTWRLPSVPEAGTLIRAESLKNHRLDYLDYEGEVSGGRGTVKRWDAGDYRATEVGESRVDVELHGDKLRGQAILAAGQDGTWSFYLT